MLLLPYLFTYDKQFFKKIFLGSCEAMKMAMVDIGLIASSTISDILITSHLEYRHTWIFSRCLNFLN